MPCHIYQLSIHINKFIELLGYELTVDEYDAIFFIWGSESKNL